MVLGHTLNIIRENRRDWSDEVRLTASSVQRQYGTCPFDFVSAVSLATTHGVGYRLYQYGLRFDPLTCEVPGIQILTTCVSSVIVLTAKSIVRRNFDETVVVKLT